MSIYADKSFLIFCCVVAAVLGAIFGSFLNCAAWRIAHGEAFWKGRSRCPACGHALSAPDLVPVFSWILLRGKCRYCGAKVSVRYLVTELLFALLTLLCLLRFDLTVLCLRNWIFLCCLFCLSLVDLETMVIPNGCLIVAVCAWLAALPLLRPGWRVILNSLIAALLFGGGILLLSLLMDRLLKRESLGGGDVKLLAVTGLYLGIVGSLFQLILACVLGLVFVLVRRRAGSKREPFPFGPAIAAAAYLVLLWGGAVINWYLGLLRL